MKFFPKLIITVLIITSLTPIITNNVNYKTTNETNFYVLGDSLSDTGALVGAGTQFFQSNSWIFPNVKKVKLESPYYSDSFSNGPVAVQIVANKLGVKLTPGWKFRDLLFTTHEQEGNNYAVGGAQSSNRIDLKGEIFINKFDINAQVDALLYQHKVENNDKIFLEIGGNDIIYAMTKNLKFMQNMVISNAIANEKIALEKLISNGERHILVANLPMASLIPMFNKDESKVLRVKELVNMFNTQWTSMISNLNEKYNNPIKPYSLFDGMNQAMAAFRQESNHNTIDSAVTTNFDNLLNNGILTPEYNQGVNRENIKDYFFFDDVHPTKWGHNFIADQLLNLIEKW